MAHQQHESTGVGAPVMTQADTPQTAPQTKVIGLLAEFDSPDALLAAAERVREAGYAKDRRIQSVPHPRHRRSAGDPPHRIALAGADGGDRWRARSLDRRVVDQFDRLPHRGQRQAVVQSSGSRPVAFELTILAAGTAAFIGMLALNRLPRLANPLFRKPSFLRA
jgi:hypothetical protein